MEREDAEGEAPIAASAYTGQVLYSYDAEGRFYEIDTETFQRTKVSDALYGQTYTFETVDDWDRRDLYRGMRNGSGRHGPMTRHRQAVRRSDGQQ